MKKIYTAPAIEQVAMEVEGVICESTSFGGKTDHFDAPQRREKNSWDEYREEN